MENELTDEPMTLEQALALSEEVSPAPMHAAAALRVLAGHIRALTEPGAPGWDKTDAILALQRQTLERLDATRTAAPKTPRKPKFEKKSDWAEHMANETAARGRQLEKQPLKIGQKHKDDTSTGAMIHVNGPELLPTGTKLYTHQQSPTASSAVTWDAHDAFEQFLAAEIDAAPKALRRLGEWLTQVLDDDQWATANRMLLGAVMESNRQQPTDTERSIVFDNDLYYFLTNIANGIDTVCQIAEASNWLVRIDKARAAMKATGEGS